MKKIITIGEILVEIMADSPGSGFLEPIALTGPFPSGAPAIFIDQAARLGQPCAIISRVGNDDFGRVNIERLKADGVDTAAISVDHSRPTGSAFVRYRKDGSRDFVFNIRHSACGYLTETDAAKKALAEADHLHVMGSSLSTPELIEMNLRAVKSFKSRGGTVSFDPNLRKEILSSPGMREAMIEILSRADLFLPSGDELFLLTQAKDTKGATDELFALGIKVVVQKLGAEGLKYFDNKGEHFIPAFPAVEIDPTGAGDCFGATFTALWLRGVSNQEAAMMAAAAGAFAVGKRGPMEGAATLETLRNFIADLQQT